MKTYQDFYNQVEGEDRLMVDILRDIVYEVESNFREKISYDVPYYFLHSRVCFIWPSAVKFGPKKGVKFGFCKGAHLDDFDTILDTEGRKEIGTITFLKAEDIKAKQIKELLYQALILDKEIWDNKRK